MTPLRHCRLAALAVGLALLAARPALAGPAEPLLRLVPAEASLCLVLQDLRAHVRTVAASPFAEWAGGSAVGKRVGGGPEANQLRAAAGFVLAPFGVTADDLLDDVFGDAVVFAYRPGPPGKPDAEAGLILVKPRKPDTLLKVIGKLNDMQTASGEVKAVREATHRGRAYTAREKPNGGAEFYLVRDGVFAFSGQEAAVRAVIDRDLDGADAGGPLAGLRKLGLADAAAVVWLRPRAFDAELRARAAAARDPKEQAFLTPFADLWAAVDGVGLYLQPGTGLELGVAVAADRSRVPAALAPVLLPSSGASAVWGAVPSDALVALGGRADVPKLLDTLAAFLPEDGRKGLREAVANGLGPVVGRDKLPAVLRGIGPDWAAWATAPPAGSGEWLPRSAVAVRLADAPDGEVTRAVTQALDLGWHLARVKFNQTHDAQAESGEERQGATVVRFLASEKGFPTGFRPCFAVKGGFLVVGTTPAVVAAFDPTAATVPDPPLFRLSGTGVREYVRGHRDAVAGAVAAAQGRAVKDVVADFSGLIDALAAVDTLELRYDAADGVARLRWHVAPVKPLARPEPAR